MKKGLIILLLIGLFVLPTMIFAQGEPGIGNFINFSLIMNNLITPVWQFFVGLSVIMFIFAGTLFLTASGDPGKINTARGAVVWGVVGIVVAILAFSILSIISRIIR